MFGRFSVDVGEMLGRCWGGLLLILSRMLWFCDPPATPYRISVGPETLFLLHKSDGSGVPCGFTVFRKLREGFGRFSVDFGEVLGRCSVGVG